MSIDIQVQARFIPEQSSPEQERYVFAYKVTITNNGQESAQLLRRHWVITDANENTQEVEGEGVIGEQPTLLPGQHYHYQSGAVIATEVGTMTGSYLFEHTNGQQTQEPIPIFSLTHPKALH